MNNGKVYLAFRAGDDGKKPMQWWPVKGQPVHLPEAEGTLRLFTYRDGPAVFVCDDRTGLAIAFSTTQPRAREAARRVIVEKGITKVEAALKETFERYKPGPKPKIKLNT